MDYKTLHYSEKKETYKLIQSKYRYSLITFKKRVKLMENRDVVELNIYSEKLGYEHPPLINVLWNKCDGYGYYVFMFRDSKTFRITAMYRVIRVNGYRCEIYKRNKKKTYKQILSMVKSDGLTRRYMVNIFFSLINLTLDDII